MKKIKGDVCHDRLVKEIKPALEYYDGVNYGEWRREIKEKLFSLLGIDEIAKNACKLPPAPSAPTRPRYLP